jgi:hypothetical protein
LDNSSDGLLAYCISGFGKFFIEISHFLKTRASPIAKTKGLTENKTKLNMSSTKRPRCADANEVLIGNQYVLRNLICNWLPVVLATRSCVGKLYLIVTVNLNINKKPTEYAPKEVEGRCSDGKC